MKRYIANTCKAFAAVTLLAAGMVFSSCDNKDNEVWYSNVPNIEGEGVHNHAVTLELEQTVQLKATTTEKGGVDWFSSHPDVASVSEDGLVTALSLGKTLIEVRPKVFDFTNGNYVTVTVVDKSLALVDDAIDQSEAE